MIISEAAEASGATPRAIRLYESLGLISVHRRGKYRYFSEQDIEFIKLIKEAQSLGIQLSEIKALTSSSQEFDWYKVNDLILRKQADTAQEIDRLKKHYARLKSYHHSIEECIKGLDSAPEVKL